MQWLKSGSGSCLRGACGSKPFMKPHRNGVPENTREPDTSPGNTLVSLSLKLIFSCEKHSKILDFDWLPCIISDLDILPIYTFPVRPEQRIFSCHFRTTTAGNFILKLIMTAICYPDYPRFITRKGCFILRACGCGLIHCARRASV